MAEEGFKLKPTEIFNADDEVCSRLMQDPVEPISHKLTPYSTFKKVQVKTGIGNNNGSPSFIGQLDVMKGDA